MWIKYVVQSYFSLILSLSLSKEFFKRKQKRFCSFLIYKKKQNGQFFDTRTARPFGKANDSQQRGAHIWWGLWLHRHIKKLSVQAYRCGAYPALQAQWKTDFLRKEKDSALAAAEPTEAFTGKQNDRGFDSLVEFLFKLFVDSR